MDAKPASAPAAPQQKLLTVPNVISAARLALVPIFVWLFLTDREEAAVILYGAGAWTDFVDGYVARRFDQVSELGKLLDPLADRVFIVSLAVVLVADGSLPWALALVIVARDLLLLSAWPLLEKRKVERIAVNRVGKTATGSLFFGLTWLAVEQTSWSWARYGDTIGIIFVGLGAVLYWIAAGMYATQARRKLRSLRGGPR